MTVFVKLVASSTDPCGYITYVFELLDEYDIEIWKYKHVTCVRYPNWQCRQLKIGDTGFVEINIVKAGIDTWYDGENQIPYKNNAKQFLRFIDKEETEEEEYIL